MLKIAALYLCWTILLVSGTTDILDKPRNVVANASSVALSSIIDSKAAVDDVNKEPTDPVPPATPTTTPKPDTTTPAITTTPSTPMTTTVAPTTTSAPMTTTPTPAPNTTTSTVPPRTTPPTTPPTTTVAPVTTPAPKPPSKTGQWIVKGKNETCIVIQMAVHFNVTYRNEDNKTIYKDITLPTDNVTTVATGDCGAKEQNINLTWNSGNDSLLIHFVKNDSTSHYDIHHVEVALSSNEFPNITSNATLNFVHNASQFSTSLRSSYRCVRPQTLTLTKVGENSTSGWLTVSDLQFQAFKQDNVTTFGAAQDCSSDVPDVVPIAVGCALTVLVIVVLVAYLIGRRRSQARGYVSM